MPEKLEKPTVEATLRLAPDKVRVLLDCRDPHRDLAGTIEAILAACEDLNLPEYPDADFLRTALCRICEPGADIKDATLVLGTPPTPPQDGKLLWSRDYFVEGWHTDADGEQVDYWDKLDNRSVYNGENLVIVQPAVPGVPGSDVYGNPVAVAKPAPVKVRCGKGIAESIDGAGRRVLTAAASGRLRFTDNTVAIDEVYGIKGDVGLGTGNIVHSGTVQIDGDIKAGASIKADGDVVVKGMVEPSELRVGGSLTVQGGIIGSHSTRILVGGDIAARYIHEAEIESGGDILVSGEINYCDITTRGRVDASTGRIVGGRTLAQLGIVVGEAGASGATGTTLAAGAEAYRSQTLAAIQQKIAKMEAARQELARAIDTTCADGDQVDNAESAFVASLRDKNASLGEHIATLRARATNFADEPPGESREEIFIQKACWSGTTIHLGSEKCHVRASVPRPRLAKLVDGSVRLLPLGEDNGPASE